MNTETDPVKESFCRGECQKMLPALDFNKRSDTANGLQYKCRKCQSSQGKARWKAKIGVAHTPEGKARSAAYMKEYAPRWRKTEAGKLSTQASQEKQNRCPKVKKVKRLWKLKRTHGITEAEYNDLLRQQNGVCAICFRPPANTNPQNAYLAVDHDHITGEVRGLLCKPCNAAIGLLQDDPQIIENAKAYVVSHSSPVAEPAAA